MSFESNLKNLNFIYFKQQCFLNNPPINFPSYNPHNIKFIVQLSISFALQSRYSLHIAKMMQSERECETMEIMSEYISLHSQIGTVTSKMEILQFRWNIFALLIGKINKKTITVIEKIIQLSIFTFVALHNVWQFILYLSFAWSDFLLSNDEKSKIFFYNA